MSIGWVVFWKCVVVAVWGGLADSYRHIRARHRESGLALKYDQKRRAYVLSDPFTTFERWAKIGLWIAAIIFVPYTMFVVYTLINLPAG